jgi:cell division protein FtsB
MKDKKWPIWHILLIVLAGIVTLRQASSVWKLVQAGDRIKQAQFELDSSKSENLQLQSQLAQIDNPQFIEKEAREKLGFGREGEIVYILPEVKPDSRTKVVVATNTPNWKKWWDLYIRL